VTIDAIYEKGLARFMGIDLLVAPGALVPREETELLGRTAIAAITAQGTKAPRVIDMGCGSGNLACSIAMNVPQAHLWACDLTMPCVNITERNVRNLGLSDRVSVHQGDLFAAVDGLGLEGSIDAIVCNPPYISDKRLAGDRAELLSHEPREAFDGGPYGLSVHQRVLRDAPRFLRPGGVLMFEIGIGQSRQVELLYQRARCYDDIRLVTASDGEVRVVCGQLRAQLQGTSSAA